MSSSVQNQHYNTNGPEKEPRKKKVRKLCLHGHYCNPNYDFFITPFKFDQILIPNNSTTCVLISQEMTFQPLNPWNAPFVSVHFRAIRLAVFTSAKGGKEYDEC